MQKFITERAEETAKIGFDLSQKLKNSREEKSRIILLYGELGTGKTTFVQGFAKGLGINNYVKSPTFIILQSYDIEGNKNLIKFIHIDAYRLKNGEELRQIGAEEIFADKSKIVLIEWAENISEIIPDKSIKIFLKHLEGDKREIVFKI